MNRLGFDQGNVRTIRSAKRLAAPVLPTITGTIDAKGAGARQMDVKQPVLPIKVGTIEDLGVPRAGTTDFGQYYRQLGRARGSVLPTETGTTSPSKTEEVPQDKVRWYYWW